MPSASAPDVPAAPTGRTRGAVWIARLLLLIGAPVLFLAVLEGALRLTGFGRNPDFFIPDTQPGIYRTNPRFTEAFFAASSGFKPLNFRIAQTKPAGTKRVFVLGESAAMGVPEPGFGLAAHLRAQLRAAYPGRSIEVYNLGLTAINSHVIRLIAEAAGRFAPDVFVIYMGNNEVVGPYGPGSAISDRMLPLGIIHASTWARSTRTGQLLQRIAARFRHNGTNFRDWRGMEMFAGRTVAADDPRLSAVYRNFDANLSDIIAIAHTAGAKVVLSTVAVNLADCAPFASVHRHGMSATELGDWKQTLDHAIEAEELGDASVEKSALAKALQLDPTYAETHFRRGRLLLGSGDLAAARREFCDARQYDALRFRADEHLNAIIRRAAHSHSAFVTLVDAAGAMGASATSSGPISDHHQFFDHVHLTWEGNDALTRLLAPAVASALFGQPPPLDRWLGIDTCASRMGFTRYGRLTMLAQMDGLTGRPPFTSQLTFAHDRTALQDALNTLTASLRSADALRSDILTIETALDDDPRNAFLMFHAAAANAQIKATQHALELNERLLSVEPPAAENLAQKAFLLATLGRTNEAETTLLESCRREPYYFQTYGLLAQVWMANQQFGKARAYFETLVARMPDSIAVRLAYAQVLAASGEWTAAEAQWRAVLDRSPANEAALEPMVQRLSARKMPDAALDLMLKAFASDPRSFPNTERLLQFYADRGDREKVAQFMGALADSGPVTPALHADRGAMLLELGRKHEALIEFVQARRAAEKTGDAEILKRATEAIRDNALQ